MNVWEAIASLVVVLFFSAWAFALGYGYRDAKIKAEAVEHGYAIHCPMDGRWAWKGECQND